jgi:Nitronate monooxygenase
MGFVVHEQLAAAVTNAGGLGVLGASPDPADSLPVMVERLRALTSGPFGVDLICVDTGFGPASTDKHIDVCVQLDVPLVVFHHDPPPARWVNTLRAGADGVWVGTAVEANAHPCRPRPRPAVIGKRWSTRLAKGWGSAKHCPGGREPPGDDGSGIRHTRCLAPAPRPDVNSEELSCPLSAGGVAYFVFGP